MTPKCIPAFILCALLLGLFTTRSIAQEQGGRVDITPQKVILNPRDRGGDFTLLNLSDTSSLIRIETINYRQKEEGGYTLLSGPLNPVFDPEKVLRLSPRQFTMPSGGQQKVRFSIRKPADLPDGEYRFHIKAIRQGTPKTDTPTKDSQAVGMAVNVGVIIPVIVRHGNVSAQATLSDVKYVAANGQGAPQMNLTINRSGNASTIGTLKVLWTPQGGKAEEIGIASNMNVFPELERRLVQVSLMKTPEGPGEFQITYMNDETKALYATTTLAK